MLGTRLEIGLGLRLGLELVQISSNQFFKSVLKSGRRVIVRSRVRVQVRF